MAATDPATLSAGEKNSLCCVYASLILHDSNKPITQDNLSKLIKASGNKVDEIFIKMFAEAMKGQDVAALFLTVSAGAPAASAAAEHEEPVKEKSKKPEPKVEKKEEPKVEEALAGGLGNMFGDDM